ncbi:MAG: adenylyltransferase/cytidyltransferase family protein [Candidatus Acidiferrales bacterium]
MGRLISQDELILQRHEWKCNGQRVVFASGRFDLLHPGHSRLLEQARSCGDILVVGLASDAAIAAQEGRGHPITPAEERAEILAALAAVDYVVEYAGNSERSLIAKLSPDFVVRGGEAGSQESSFREDDEIRAAGGEVIRIPLEPGHSTAGLLERIAPFKA